MTLIIDSGFSGYGTTFSDADVNAYLTAVETADNQALEFATAVAINDFVLGCKADGIWTAIKASCILTGARTKEGAVVPLVNASGVAPTLNGTADGWNYNRETGLQGNGTDNYINSGRNNSPASGGDPQNSVSHAVWISSVPAGAYVPIGAGFNLTGSTRCAPNPGSGTSVRIRTAAAFTSTLTGATVPSNNTFFGYRRSAFNASLLRMNSTEYTFTEASETPFVGNVFVFADNNAGSATGFMGGRLAFYSIGESLNLALLQARVAALITAIGAAIP